MAAVEVQPTLEYRGGQLNAVPEVENFTNWKKRFMCHIIDERKATNLDQRLKSLIMSVLLDDQMNSVINCLTAKSTWDDLILYHEGPFDVKESRVMDLQLCYNTFKFKEGESLTQTFTRYKALMNELVNDGINLSKLEINIGFINRLPKKWLTFCQSLRNTNHVKDSNLASLFGKLKYEENLIDNIYETKKNKSLISATPLSTDFFSTSIVHDFQDSPNDEEDTRSSNEVLKGSVVQKQLTKLNAINVARRGHFARDYWSKTSVPSYQSPFQSKSLSPSQHKPELRPTKDFEAKYNKVKAKLSLLSLSALASKALTVKNKCLIAEAYEWDEEEVSSDDNEMVEVKVLMDLAEDNDVVSKEGARNGEWVKISMRKCISEQILSQKKRIMGVDQLTEDPSNSGQKVLVFVKSLANDTKVTILVLKDPATDYDLADESSVCSTPLPPLKKLDGVEPISGPKTIKSILRSKFTFKSEALKGVIINEPSSAPAKGNKSSSALKVHSTPAGKLKSVKIKDDHPLAIVMKELNNLKLQFSKNQSSYSRSNQPQQDYLSRKIDHLRNPQHTFKRYEVCGSLTHTTTNHYDIELFKRGEAIQAKKVEALKSARTNASNA
ncbi:hypothetical protein Tco_0535973 [Tanacetum coccineum]